MFHRPSTWLLSALIAGVLAGCGGSSSSTNGSTASPTTATTSSTPAGGTSTTTSTPTVSRAAAQAAVNACKQAIQAESTLPVGAKAKLEGVCAKAASGDRTALKNAAREVCEEVVKTSVPASAREQALAACKQK